MSFNTQSRFDPRFFATSERWVLTIVCLEVGASISAPRHPQELTVQSANPPIFSRLSSSVCDLYQQRLNRLWSAIGYQKPHQRNQGHSVIFLEGYEDNPDKRANFGDTWCWAADFVLQNSNEVCTSIIQNRPGKVRTAAFDYNKPRHEINDYERTHLYWLKYDPQKEDFTIQNPSHRISIRNDHQHFHSSISLYVSRLQGLELQNTIKKEQILGAPTLSILGNNCAAWSLTKISQVLKIDLSTQGMVFPSIPKGVKTQVEKLLHEKIVTAIEMNNYLLIDTCLMHGASGYLALIIAIRFQNLNIIRWLIEQKGVQVNDCPELSFPLLINMWDLRKTNKPGGVANYYLDFDCQENKFLSNLPAPIIEAAVNANLEIVQYLLDKGANKSATHYTFRIIGDFKYKFYYNAYVASKLANRADLAILLFDSSFKEVKEVFQRIGIDCPFSS